MDLDDVGNKARVRIPPYTDEELEAGWERLRRAAEERGLDVDDPE